MDASVDANVFIHLYQSNQKDLLFTSFDRLYIFEYIVDVEIKKNASKVFQEVQEDITAGRLVRIGFYDLIQKGIKNLFIKVYEDNLKLFAYDRGESYAVALASVMGIEALVSNDTKKGGPHETLLSELIDNVIPFCFYELLFLKYLVDDITAEEFQLRFEAISSNFTYPMNFYSKIKCILRRFHSSYGSERDLQWIHEFCTSYNIDLRAKVHTLGAFLRNER
ncbi:hypothetical protein [Proteiniclasticum ruminis]|uniref:hypothetical protein n=1 Tax=Proteiniclasticum ruminis TaxID=398199 RepID=UPI0028963D77|nr:hypothetical protein [Proteiniclasticum ruminis]